MLMSGCAGQGNAASVTGQDFSYQPIQDLSFYAHNCQSFPTAYDVNHRQTDYIQRYYVYNHTMAGSVSSDQYLTYALLEITVNTPHGITSIFLAIPPDHLSDIALRDGAVIEFKSYNYDDGSNENVITYAHIIDFDQNGTHPTYETFT